MQDGIEAIIVENALTLNSGQRWPRQESEYFKIVCGLKHNVMDGIQTSMRSKTNAHIHETAWSQTATSWKQYILRRQKPQDSFHSNTILWKFSVVRLVSFDNFTI